MALVARPPELPIAFKPSFQRSSLISSMPGSCPWGLGGSLVFHLEGDEFKQSSLKAGDLTNAACERVASFSRPGSSFASRLLRDVKFFKSSLQRQENDVDTVVLACKLASVGYSVSVRVALGGRGASCFQHLRHEFLLVKGTGEVDGVDFIVDLHFRDQFEIPQPTAAYANLVAQVPATFVGPLSRLMPIVQVLCAEMAESFKAKDLTLPPWRKTQSVLSKWMPTKMRDVNVSEHAARDLQPQLPQSESRVSLAVARGSIRKVIRNTNYESSGKSQQQPTKQIGFPI